MGPTALNRTCLCRARESNSRPLYPGPRHVGKQPGGEDAAHEVVIARVARRRGGVGVEARLGQAVAVQVTFESKGLKPVSHLTGSRVEIRCFQAMGQLDSTCTARPGASSAAPALRVATPGSQIGYIWNIQGCQSRVSNWLQGNHTGCHQLTWCN
jgi:hypothetical protein